MGNVGNPAYLKYYFEKKGSQQSVDIIAGQKEDIPLVTDFIKIENPGNIWYISAHEQPSPEFLDFMEKNFTKLDHQMLYNADVWLFYNR